MEVFALPSRSFNELEALIARLERSAELASDENGLVPDRIASAFRDWFDELETADPDDFASLLGGGVEQAADGLLWVLAPGSLAVKRDGQGVLHDIEIVAPEIVALDGPPKLFYRYKIDGPGTAMTSADSVEHVGADYRMQKWNPQTGEYVDEDEGEDDLVAAAG